MHHEPQIPSSNLLPPVFCLAWRWTAGTARRGGGSRVRARGTGAGISPGTPQCETGALGRTGTTNAYFYIPVVIQKVMFI